MSVLKNLVANLVRHRSAAADRRFVERGVREGWLTPARAPTKGPPPCLPVTSTEQLLRELDEDRADR